MKIKKTVHIVGRYVEYEEMFVQHGWTLVSDIDDADLVQFCGGADVSPCMYEEKRLLSTHTNPDRDVYEVNIFKLAKGLGVPMAGICRGGQFLHVVNGGKLWQHVTNHAINGTHHMFLTPKYSYLETKAQSGFQVSSTHHQMMVEDIGEIIGISTICTFKRNETKTLGQAQTGRDLEIVYHRDTNSLCFQPHPEFFPKNHPCQRLYFQLISKLLFPKGKKK